MTTVQAPKINERLCEIEKFLRNNPPGSNPLIKKAIEIADIALKESKTYHDALMQSQSKANDLEHDLAKVTDDRNTYKNIQQDIISELEIVVGTHCDVLTEEEKMDLAIAEDSKEDSPKKFRDFVVSLVQRRLECEDEKNRILEQLEMVQLAMTAKQQPEASDQDSDRVKTILSACTRTLGVSIGSALAIREKATSEEDKAKILDNIEPALTCFFRVEDLLEWRFLKPVYGSTWQACRKDYFTPGALSHFQNDSALRKLYNAHRIRFMAGNAGRREGDATTTDAPATATHEEEIDEETNEMSFVLDTWVKDISKGYDVTKT